MQRTWTENQNLAIQTDGRDICVSAGAGSGKTGVLAERFVRLVMQSRTGAFPPEFCAKVGEILVLTFTDKATREMKTRIVDGLTRCRLTDELHEVEEAYISTIHGFCARVLRDNPFEVGIDRHFTVMEESQAQRLLFQTVENVIEAEYDAENKEIVELVAAVQLLRWRGEEHDDPVASLAISVQSLMSKFRSAGVHIEELERHYKSGEHVTARKSEELVQALIAPIVAEIRVCAFSLQGLYAALNGLSREICDAILNGARAARPDAPPTDILAALRPVLRELRKSHDIPPSTSAPEIQFAQHIARLRSTFEHCGSVFESVLPDTDQSESTCHWMLGLTCAVWRGYDEAKRTVSKIDNDDLQYKCVRLFEEYPEVLARYQQRFRHLLVDEFQDTNALQMRLLELLHVNSAPAPVRNYLFVVGDVQQSIYGFRGAEPSLFRSLEQSSHDCSDRLHVSLTTNFRSRPEILRFITVLFSQIGKGPGVSFTPLEPGGDFEAAPAPSVEFLVSTDLVRQDYLDLEPTVLAHRIRKMTADQEQVVSNASDGGSRRPIQYRDIAVLLRQFTDIEKYEEAFIRAGIPFAVMGGGRGYDAKPEIRDLFNILTVLDNPLNDLALMAALRSPIVGVDIDSLYRIVEFAKGKCQTIVFMSSGDEITTVNPVVRPRPLYIALQELLCSCTLPETEDAKLRTFVEVVDSLREDVDRVPVGQTVERLISHTAYDARLLCRPNGRRRYANLRKLLQIAHEDRGTCLAGFISRLGSMDRLADRETDGYQYSNTDVVRFYTIHGAKGLEFPVVILADLSRSLEHPERRLFACDPHTLAIGTRVCGSRDAAYLAIDHERRRTSLEESERLLYVGMTRARERLVLCGNLGRNRGPNWGDLVFSAFGITEAPTEPITQTLVGGIQATVTPMAHYVRPNLFDGDDGADRIDDATFMRFADSLTGALLNGAPIETVVP